MVDQRPVCDLDQGFWSLCRQRAHAGAKSCGEDHQGSWGGHVALQI
jgi:hypothetical protein